MPVKLSNGESIVKGQTITSFTNAEEEFVKLTEAMPFLLETKLKDLGGNFVGAENFQVNVQVSIDYRIISPTFTFHHVINLSCHIFYFYLDFVNGWGFFHNRLAEELLLDKIHRLPDLWLKKSCHL